MTHGKLLLLLLLLLLRLLLHDVYLPGAAAI